MAEPFFSQMSKLIEGIEFPDVTLECKHFFSGAALYANDKIMASFSPAGFAIKLPEGERQELIQKGIGVEFRFFPDGPIKKEYVLLKESVIQDEQAFQEIFHQSVGFAVGK
ncbi:MAG: TfoX/Sxy family protein [Anaerolineales bacterium]|nr:TfoX/Sxy family protein [Anaerolineales bacterium]